MTVSTRSAIVGLIAVSIAFVMELTLVPLLLPAMKEQFGLSLGQLAWVFNSYGVAVAIGVLLGGWFGDLVNPKRVFAYGVLLFAAGSVLVATAGTLFPLMPLLLRIANLSIHCHYKLIVPAVAGGLLRLLSAVCCVLCGSATGNAPAANKNLHTGLG